MSTPPQIAPEALALLQAARQELAGLLPSLPASAQYSARMIANALAIANRELEDGRRLKARRAARWRRLAASIGLVIAPGQPPSEVIAKAIRAGCIDTAAEQKLRRAIAADIADWLAIDNPKALRR